MNTMIRQMVATTMETLFMRGLFGLGIALGLCVPTAYGVVATGGNTTNYSGGYEIHTFTNSTTASNFVVTVGGNVEVLVVGGAAVVARRLAAVVAVAA